MSEGLTPNGPGGVGGERTLFASAQSAPTEGIQDHGVEVLRQPTTDLDEHSSAKDQPAVRQEHHAWLDAVLEATSVTGSARSGALLKELLDAPSLGLALRSWVRSRFSTGEKLTREAVIRRLSQDLAKLDEILSRQVNAVLHHPRFQQLEASWRGLWYLTGQRKEALEQADFNETPPQIELRVLNVSKRELASDLDKAAEFDQSLSFKKIHDEGFGIAGGHPFGAVIGDYQFTNHVEDIEFLDKMSEVAAAAFCPFITAASPQLFNLENFCALERPIRLTDGFNQPDYIKWNAFRSHDDSRFVGLVLPRVLMRVPYENDGSRMDGFRFREDVEGRDQSRYLWGNAAYPFGAVLIRAFASSRWFADIRGFQRGIAGGGLVTGLPVHSFGTDRSGIVTKSSSEVAIDDYQEKELSSLGFIPLCHCKDTEYSVFFTNSSVQNPKGYSDAEATANSKISAMLQYVFCASRFAHYLKWLARNKVGGHTNQQELQRYLKRWISDYVTPDPKAPTKIKAKLPLREANIEVREIPASPGSYAVVMQLLPHYQLDGLSATLRLVMKARSPGTM